MSNDSTTDTLTDSVSNREEQLNPISEIDEPETDEISDTSSGYFPLRPRPATRVLTEDQSEDLYERYVENSDCIRFDLPQRQVRTQLDPENKAIDDLVFGKFHFEIPEPSSGDVLEITFPDDSRKVKISLSFAKYHSSTIHTMLSSELLGEKSTLHFRSLDRKTFLRLFGLIYNPGRLNECAHLLLRKNVLENILMAAQFLEIGQVKSLICMAIPELINRHKEILRYFQNYFIENIDARRAREVKEEGKYSMMKLERLVPILDRFENHSGVQLILNNLYVDWDSAVVDNEKLTKRFTEPRGDALSLSAHASFEKVLLKIIENCPASNQRRDGLCEIVRPRVRRRFAY